jgi:hypothetical protein
MTADMVFSFEDVDDRGSPRRTPPLPDLYICNQVHCLEVLPRPVASGVTRGGGEEGRSEGGGVIAC